MNFEQAKELYSKARDKDKGKPFKRAYIKCVHDACFLQTVEGTALALINDENDTIFTADYNKVIEYKNALEYFTECFISPRKTPRVEAPCSIDNGHGESYFYVPGVRVNADKQFIHVPPVTKHVPDKAKNIEYTNKSKTFRRKLKAYTDLLPETVQIKNLDVCQKSIRLYAIDSTPEEDHTAFENLMDGNISVNNILLALKHTLKKTNTTTWYMGLHDIIQFYNDRAFFCPKHLRHKNFHYLINKFRDVYLMEQGYMNKVQVRQL